MLVLAGCSNRCGLQLDDLRDLRHPGARLALIWGYAGILCFGQAAFFGWGGYTYAVAAINIGETTVPPLLAVLVPAAFAALLGYFMFWGRISDVYLGVITLTVSLIFFRFVNQTGGSGTSATRRSAASTAFPARRSSNGPARGLAISWPEACSSLRPLPAARIVYFAARLLLATSSAA